MSTSQPNHKFAVVRFLNEDMAGKAVVDLVPRSWIRECEGSCFCSYPPKPYTGLIYLVKKLIKPNLIWEEFLCEVLGTAETYESGMTLVMRAVKKLSVNTTDDEAEQAANTSAAASFSDAPPFPGQGAEHQGYTPSGGEDSEEEETTPKKPGGKKRGVAHPQVSRKSEKPARAETKATKVISTNRHMTPKGLDKIATPTPDLNATPTRDLKAAPIPDLKATPTPGLKATPTPDLEATPTPDLKATPTPDLKASPTPRSPDLNAATSQLNQSESVMENKEGQGDEENDSGQKVTLKHLTEMEERIIKAVVKSKKSILHDVRDNRLKIEKVASSVDSFMRTNGQGYSPINHIDEFDKTHFDVKLPLKNTEDFLSFNEKLERHPNIFDDFAKVLTELWVPVNHKQSMTRSLTIIIERYITKEVATKYSAQGKGKLKKMNFSASPFYGALETAITTVQNTITKKDILEELGKMLAKASDWHGGRVERRLAAEERKRPRETAEDDGPQEAVRREGGDDNEMDTEP